MTELKSNIDIKNIDIHKPLFNHIIEDSDYYSLLIASREDAKAFKDACLVIRNLEKSINILVEEYRKSFEQDLINIVKSFKEVKSVSFWLSLDLKGPRGSISTWFIPYTMSIVFTDESEFNFSPDEEFFNPKNVSKEYKSIAEQVNEKIMTYFQLLSNNTSFFCYTDDPSSVVTLTITHDSVILNHGDEESN